MWNVYFKNQISFCGISSCGRIIHLSLGGWNDGYAFLLPLISIFNQQRWHWVMLLLLPTNYLGLEAENFSIRESAVDKVLTGRNIKKNYYEHEVVFFTLCLQSIKISFYKQWFKIYFIFVLFFKFDLTTSDCISLSLSFSLPFSLPHRCKRWKANKSPQQLEETNQCQFWLAQWSVTEEADWTSTSDVLEAVFAACVIVSEVASNLSDIDFTASVSLPHYQLHLFCSDWNRAAFAYLFVHKHTAICAHMCLTCLS